MIKFQRNYKLTVHEDTKEAIVITYPLTLEFAISRANLSMAGTATFRIYNLSAETRGKIYKNPVNIDKMIRIKLEAGYGDSLSTIFDGNVSWARSSRGEGQTNFITEINAFDYAFVMVNSQSSWTVQDPDSSQDKVIRRLCQDLKAPVDGVYKSIPIGAIGSFSTRQRRSFSVSGSTWEALKTETGNRCYIDNGKVFCMSSNEIVAGDIPVINSDSGLLGSPKVDGQFIVFDMVFEPALKIGQKVKLDARTLSNEGDNFSAHNGYYKVIGLDHTGTISGAVAGKCKTRCTLLIGSAGEDDPFTLLEDGK